MTNGVFFLIQLLPIIVFLIVDGLFSNTIYSIISAIVVALFYMTFSFFKTGNIDYMILIDVALITALGIVSIVVKNDIFFKLKPAIIDVVAIIFMIVLIFASEKFLLSYFIRFMPPNLNFNQAFIPYLKRMLLFTSLYTLLHGLAVWYTAFNSSRRTWALVSGPGYFFLFIPMMLWIVVKKIRTRKRVEVID